MKIILATIPHTGTWFFEKLLKDHGFAVETMHVTRNSMPRVKIMVDQGMPVVTTVRSLDKVRESWAVRNRPLDQWCEHLECWFELMAYKPHIVSVDCQKEERLEALGDALGVQFKTKWEPVNASH